MSDQRDTVVKMPQLRNCRILGIDPGSRFTGFGILDSDKQRSRYVTSGCIRVDDQPWPQRLLSLFDHIAALIADYQPHEVAVEQLIFARDAAAALKLGQARGAILCAALKAGLTVQEYSPKSVKLAVVGTGNADKAQVQHMMRALLALPTTPGADEADALAIALCHAHSRQLTTGQRATASWRDFRPPTNALVNQSNSIPTAIKKL